MTRKRLSGQKKATAALIIAKPVAQHVLPTSTESDPKRLSSIGVSFLKFTISHKIFHSYPNSNEGKLTRKYEVEVSKFKQWKLYDSVGNYIILEGVEKCYTIVEPFVISEKNASGKLKSPPSKIDSEFYGRQFQNIEATIEYEFRNRALLLQAFSHQSYKHVSKFGSYERLEFLGDAVLEYLIVRYLYDHNSEFNRGEIAKYRGKFTSNETLACLTLKHGLQKYILHNSKKKIDQKCYADIFESLAGAVFIDSGMNLDVTWKVFYKLFKGFKCFREIDSKNE